MIVLTHSCDLVPEQGPTPELVAVAAIDPLKRFCAANPSYGHANQRNHLRAGRMPSLHLLASIVDPGDNQSALVVDFKEIYSLPYAYLVRHAAKLGLRYRLNPPYLEHFSQAFAHFLCESAYLREFRNTDSAACERLGRFSGIRPQTVPWKDPHPLLIVNPTRLRKRLSPSSFRAPVRLLSARFR